jgi:hypothetical protein
MENLLACSDARRALKASQCSFNSCSDIVATQLETRPLCLEHFLSVSVQEIDARSACLKAIPVDTAAAAGLKDFLADCVQQAEALAGSQDLAHAPYRDRLHEILRRSSQLNRSLRRSPRIPVSVPIWLRREDVRHTWEEETWTSMLSLHGAGFVCRHSVQVNGKVVLCRRDKGKRAEARVVYSRFDSEGRRHIGVELLGRDDFWDAPQFAVSAPQ